MQVAEVAAGEQLVVLDTELVRIWTPHREQAEKQLQQTTMALLGPVDGILVVY
jgi:hypothetical protein